jgi:uncharacterized protein YndB with AHSA1/START domain
MTPQKPKPRTVEPEVRIDAPQEAVWRALTEANELARWLPPIAAGKPGLGEELLLCWGPHLEWRTEVVTFDVGRHLVWRDKAPTQLGPPEAQASSAETTQGFNHMAVDWTLEAAGGKVLVRLVQSGFGEGDAWDDFYDGTNLGWRVFLLALRHYLERHSGVRRDMVSVRRPARGGPTVPWNRVWSAEGFAPTPAAAAFTPGKRFRLLLGKERLEGTVELVRAPRGFFGTVASLDDATLLVEMEPGRDALHCGIWLSTYGRAPERVKSLQEALTGMADRAFSGMA